MKNKKILISKEIKKPYFSVITVVKDDEKKIILTLKSIKNLNPKKRHISAVVDNIEVRNAKKIIVRKNKKVKFDLLYDKNKILQKKIKNEQLRNETS